MPALARMSRGWHGELELSQSWKVYHIYAISIPYGEKRIWDQGLSYTDEELGHTATQNMP